MRTFFRAAFARPARDSLKSRALVLTSTLIVAGFVLAVIVDLGLDRREKLRSGERNVEYFGHLLAEQTARSIESLEILLGEMTLDLKRGPDWRTWADLEGHKYLLQRHTRGLPQLRDLILFDDGGRQRFASTGSNPARATIADRPYFQALASGTEQLSFGPAIGRAADHDMFGLAHRLSDAEGRFTGVVVSTYDTTHFQETCWSERWHEELDAALVDPQGVVVTLCGPGRINKTPSAAGRLVTEILGDGHLTGLALRTGVFTHDNYVVGVAPVKGLPDLRIVVVLSQDVLLASWRRRIVEVLVLITLAAGIGVVGGRTIHRQLRELRRLTRQLRDSHDQLEDRVREATRELSRKKEDAERSNLSKSRFLAAASHDLRQPLHAIALFSADLKQIAQQAEVRQAGENIATAVAVVSGLLENLLDISRIDLAGLTPIARPVAVAEILERVAATYVRPAADKYLFLCTRPTSLWCHTDPAMLERLLGSLVANAIQYTEHGGILIAVRRRGQRMRIEVRDSGIGIPEDQQHLIFDEFYQVANPERTAEKGLGLGLSIAARLAAALGTQIVLRSKPGCGSVFAIELPIAEPPAAEAEIAQLPEVSSAAGRPAVWLVGEAARIEQLPDLLANWGFAAECVRDAATVGRRLAVPECKPIAIVTSTEDALELAALSSPLIVLGTCPSAIESAYKLTLPLRPAKLRALLRSLAEDAVTASAPAQASIKA